MRVEKLRKTTGGDFAAWQIFYCKRGEGSLAPDLGRSDVAAFFDNLPITKQTKYL